ncbi:MAG: ABC transporter permease [Alphaproteobacteria bacterium]|nr:MAG: ABC transporter permease [Alphaproteobacteria bacterium]
MSPPTSWSARWIRGCAVSSVAEPARPRHAGLAALGRVLAEPMGLFGLALVVLVIVSAVFADQLAAYNPTRMMPRDRFADPGWTHLMGTDHLGRDLFARVLHGGRIALWVALVATSISLALGAVLGLIAGYGPRWLDNLLILIFDAVKSFPTVMLALTLVTLFGPSLTAVMVVVVLVATPSYARVIRTQTMALKTSEFILAARAMGAGMGRILRVHVLPNVIGPVLILASMDIPVVIAIEAGMSFLGLGVRPPTPSWGAILNDGFTNIRETPWIAVAGGLPVILTTLGFTFLGETLRDVFDPRLRREG